MPRPSQPSRQPTSAPESVCRSLLAADPRPAIRAAPALHLRAVLADITSHLCHRARNKASDAIVAAPPPANWPGACQIGSGMRAGFQLYDDLSRAIAANWLHALRFDPARAAADADYHATVIGPFLAAASKHRLRGLLLTLTDHIQAVTADADTSAALSASTQLPDELWDVGTGVTAAIALYQHAVLIQATDIWYYLHDGLETGHAPAPHPFTPPPPGTLYVPVNPN